MGQLTTPKEIVISGNLYIASFDYYTGKAYTKEKNLTQSTSFTALNNFTNFLVCCSDVMVRVEPTDYPEIERRVL